MAGMTHKMSVKWNKNVYDIQFDPTLGVDALLQTIQDETGVPKERAKLMPKTKKMWKVSVMEGRGKEEKGSKGFHFLPLPHSSLTHPHSSLTHPPSLPPSLATTHTGRPQRQVRPHYSPSPPPSLPPHGFRRASRSPQGKNPVHRGHGRVRGRRGRGRPPGRAAQPREHLLHEQHTTVHKIRGGLQGGAG
jgi:hypothetical protein